MIQLASPLAQYQALAGGIRAAMGRVLEGGAYILGAELANFERAFALSCNVAHAVGVGNGTDALIVALRGLGIGPGDEVITVSHTAVATVAAVIAAGATPVLVDIDPLHYTIDPVRIEAAITPRSRAIIAVHLYGQAADLDAVSAIARARGLRLIEDCAQSTGGIYRGRSLGSVGDAGTFSFYPTKNLGAYGEGGALTTDDDQVAKFARAARSHGQTARYEHEFVGYNYRMDGFQGAILRIKLRQLYAATARRQEIAREYRARLAGARVEIPVDDSRDESVYHQFVIYTNNRNSVIAQLTAREIETVVHYPRPVHLQPAYSSIGYPPGTFPHAERACQRVLSLPVFPGMSAEQIAFVADSVRELAGTKS